MFVVLSDLTQQSAPSVSQLALAILLSPWALELLRRQGLWSVRAFCQVKSAIEGKSSEEIAAALKELPADQLAMIKKACAAGAARRLAS